MSASDPYGKLRTYVSKYFDSIYARFGLIGGDQYLEFKEFLNETMRRFSEDLYIDGDETEQFIALYREIYTKRNSSNRYAVTHLLKTKMYNTIKKTLRQLFKLESFRCLKYLTGEDQEEIHAPYSRE